MSKGSAVACLNVECRCLVGGTDEEHSERQNDLLSPNLLSNLIPLDTRGVINTSLALDLKVCNSC
jgi:hypothetical protein